MKQLRLGLIGFPIQHSLSPWIHEQFLSQGHVKGSYELMETKQEDFEKQMQAVKEKALHGFNVTVPYKETILPYLDELDQSAANIQAVNTVICTEGKWKGYNTDGIGYVKSLEQAYPEVTKDHSILLIGAGGAAKGIYHGLIQKGYLNITVSNRTIEKAVSFVQERHSVIDLLETEKTTEQYDIIINTTSVGMNPNTDESIISLQQVKPAAIVNDIVYQPIHTKFLMEAERLGANIHFGHTMLLYQAQAAFEIWTGFTPDMQGLNEQLQSILEGR